VKLRLLDWLACPDCGGPVEAEAFRRDDASGEIEEGLLRSGCGRVYPVVQAIPRMLDEGVELFPEFARRYADRLPPERRQPAGGRFSVSERLIRRTMESFGYQWTLFPEMVIDFRENFLRYMEPLTESFFRGKVGIDLGCGFGRHVYNAAQCGAEMVGVDLSRAIDAARRNTRRLANVHLVQANLYRLPFRRQCFDFAYSLGVLHHLPDPERGFACLWPLVKPGGTVLIWVYSKSRRVTNWLLETVRGITTRLSARAQTAIAYACAAADWSLFIAPYRIGSRLPVIGRLVDQITFPRLKVYSAYPFQVVCADWLDRLTAPIRFYYDGQDLDGWFRRAGLDQIRVHATGLFGWTACGQTAPTEHPSPIPS